MATRSAEKDTSNPLKDSRVNFGKLEKEDLKKNLKIERKFTSPSKDPFDTVEWGIRDAVAGDFRQNGVEAPVCWSDSAVGIVAKLYFALIDGKRENSIKTLITRVVSKIADEGLNYGYFGGIKRYKPNGTIDIDLNLDQNDLYRIFRDELTYILLHQIAAFNTPVWINLGVPGRKQSCSACYLLNVEDHMFGEDSITDWWVNEAKIFKTGAGSGVNLSKIRGSMEPISVGGIASGPVSFIRPADSAAGTIKSGSVARRAAKLVCLDIDHPDVIDFIESKVREDRRMQALRSAGFNLDPSTPLGEKEIAECTSFQNANISVRLSDKFMEAVENNEFWQMPPRTGNGPTNTIGAKPLLEKIAEAAWECADPGVSFSTTINKWHTTPSLGEIETTNPCHEVLINNNNSCNLSSINLVKFLYDDNIFDINSFNHVVDIMITAMDITCSFSELPTKKIEENTRNIRPLGLGYSNLGAALMIQGMPYDSDDGRDWTAAVTSLMTARAYKRSAELADYLGPFKHYKDNALHMESIIDKHIDNISARDHRDFSKDEIFHIAFDEWSSLERHYNGFRNSQVTVIAPCGTISFMMDCDTTGAEPAYALKTFKKLAAGGTMEQDLKCYDKAIDNLGYIDAIGILKNKDKKIFQTAGGDDPISPMGHLKMVAAIQPHISGAISKTCNLPNDATVEDIYNLYLEAWKMGIKCLSVYRDGSKATQVLSTKENNDGNSNSSDSNISGRNSLSDQEILEYPVEDKRIWDIETVNIGDAINTLSRKKMNSERQSITHKFSIGDYKGYITAGMYPDGSLGEIFLSGVGKDGSTLKGILEGWAIAISMGLQYGVPLEKFASKFSYMRFEPEGLTDNPEIRVAHSILDYVMRWLISKFGDEESHLEFGINSAKIKQQREEPEQIQAQNGRVENSGKICECGTSMLRTGTCWSCPQCGKNTGCM